MLRTAKRNTKTTQKTRFLPLFYAQKAYLFARKLRSPRPSKLHAEKRTPKKQGFAEKPQMRSVLKVHIQHTFQAKSVLSENPYSMGFPAPFSLFFFFQVQIKKEKIVNILYSYNIFTIPPALSNNPYFSKKIPSITKQNNSRARSPREFFFQKQEPNIQIKDFFPPPGRIFFQVQKTQKSKKRKKTHKHISIPGQPRRDG